jgi:hypothetical protein
MVLFLSFDYFQQNSQNLLKNKAQGYKYQTLNDKEIMKQVEGKARLITHHEIEQYTSNEAIKE